MPCPRARKIFECLTHWADCAGENGSLAADPALPPEMPSPLGGLGCWGRDLGLRPSEGGSCIDTSEKQVVEVKKRMAAVMVRTGEMCPGQRQLSGR